MLLKNNGNCFAKIIILISFFSMSYQIRIPLKQIKTKFQKSIPKKIYSNSDNSATISDNFNILDNYLFAADVTIGSNNQTLTILLDTGSEIFWVSGIGQFSSYYNPEKSKTSIKSSEKLDYEYSSGKIKGNYYSDQINFLLSKKFYTYFGVVTETNLLGYYFDGIMGLGRKYSNSKYSVLNTIKNLGGISSTKFSFKYDYNNNLNFYLGEEHEDFISTKENIASCSLIDSKYYGKNLWLCEIASFGIKNDETIVKIISLDLEVLFDTGTNNIILPSKYISDLESTFKSFNCYLYEEGNKSIGSQKAVYCRNQNNLPKIVIGLRMYRLTIGKSNFYTKMYINKEYIYRLRLLFIDDIDFCIIGQDFFYEYHTLFDDEKGVLKFYGEGEIVYYLDKKERKFNWIIIIFMIAGLIIVISIIIIIILICRRRKYSNKILLNKELLEMSSIKKPKDNDDNYESNFNQIMSITSDKIKKGINIKINSLK